MSNLSSFYWILPNFDVKVFMSMMC